MSNEDDLRRDRILAARRDKQQAASMQVMAMQASTLIGKANGKIMFLEGKCQELETRIAKLERQLTRLMGGARDG